MCCHITLQKLECSTERLLFVYMPVCSWRDSHDVLTVKYKYVRYVNCSNRIRDGKMKGPVESSPKMVDVLETASDYGTLLAAARRADCSYYI